MTKEAYHVSRLEQSGFAATVTIGSGLFFFMAMAPQSGRALFINDDGKLAAKAFIAVVPTLDQARSQAELSLLNAAGVRSSGAAAGLTNPARSRVGTAAPPLLRGTLPSLLASGPSAGSAGQSVDGASFGGPATGPLGSDSSSLAGGQQPSGLTGTGPAAPGLPVPTAGAPATPVTQDPVPAVPEPTTWLMMLFGFFAIGSALRRRTKPLQQGVGARG